MTLKPLLPYVLILGSISCKNRHASKDQYASKDNIIGYVTDDANIVGIWTMCSTYDNGIMIQANVCPTVVFNINGTGRKITSGGIAEEFSWTLKNKVLQIQHPEPNLVKSFSDTAYLVHLNKKGVSMELEISHPKKDISYFLSR